MTLTLAKAAPELQKLIAAFYAGGYPPKSPPKPRRRSPSRELARVKG